MSVLALDMRADAALRIGDPNMTRVKPEQWTLFYNDSCRQLCEKCDVLQFRATFDLTTEQVYPYPEEMTVLTRLEVNLDPTGTPLSWVPLDEKREDEFRAQTRGLYPTATVPDSYLAEQNWFWLLPAPEASIVGGGRVSYFGLPARVPDIVDTTLFELPEICQDYVISRMVIFAKAARNRLVEAAADLQAWKDDTEGLGDRMLDRAKDRPSTIAPRRRRYAGMR